MKTVHYYYWKTLWNGKMSTTRHLATEDDIRKKHPEAVRVEGSLVVRQLPETEAEKRQTFINADTNYRGSVRRRTDGSIIKFGEHE
ncbi:MAG: hypothetical protein H7340_03335 [Variovorax sp.]|nr:hypothetical protein [Variovorax sp.]